MTDFKTIYARHAAAYQHMIAFEDYEGHLPQALARIWPDGAGDVVEFGAGTGRLTVMLAPQVRYIAAFDDSAHMLAVAAQRLQTAQLTNCVLATADNARLPVPADCADLAIEGWSFGHLTGWYPDDWPHKIARVLAEMARVLKPGGTAIMLETLGTGQTSPQPPTPALADFYHRLENDAGFTHEWIRTDYRYPSPEEAAAATRFFFGDELADSLLREQRAIVPECTGIWWRTF
ncbi:class I SAM-dependent methyltransferase [Chloroflexota bacterium]